MEYQPRERGIGLVHLNNYKEIENKLIDLLGSKILAYFKFNDKIDLVENDLTNETSTLLASFLDRKLEIHDPEYGKYFTADDVMPSMVVANHNRISFWGYTYWLSTPNDYPINRSGKDPFYCEFSMENDQLTIPIICSGDNDLINIDKTWWFDIEMNWIYKILTKPSQLKIP